MKIMGLITTVSPYRGSLSPQPTYYPTPQHTYQHTYKLAYHNSIKSFITAITMPEPPFMNLLITMSSWPQRDVNGTAIQTFGAKWSEEDLCGVRPDLLVPVFSSFWQGRSLYQAWMHWMSSLWRLTGMNALLKQCLPIYCAYRPFQS